MDSRMKNTHGEEGDNGGNHNQHRDKQSVFKKVKDKAKKIKDTLKPPSHGTRAHEGEGHEATPDDDDMDEEGGDDEDEEIIHHDQDPQRRAPLVAVPSAGESARSCNEGEPKGSAAAGKPISSGDEGAVKGLAELASVPSGPFSSGTGSGPPSPVLEDAAGRKLKEDPHSHKDKSDHDYSPSNYEAKVTDPTASEGGDAGVSPTLKSTDEMNIHGDKEAAKREFPSAGSHGQLSPAPNKDMKATAQTAKPASMIVEYGKKIAAAIAGKLSLAYDKVAEVGASVVSRVQGGTTETDKSGIVNDKDKGVSVQAEAETGAGEVVNPILKSTDKMNIYGDKEAAKREFPSAGSHGQSSPAPNKDMKATAQTAKPASMIVEYGKKIAAAVAGKLSLAYDKIAEVGASVVSRVQGGKTETDESGIVNDKDKGVSVQAEAETGAGEVVNPIRSSGTNVNYNSAAAPAGAAGAAGAPAIGGTSVVGKLKHAVGSWFGNPQPSLPDPMPSSTVAGATSEFSDSGEIGEEDAAAAAAAGKARAAN